MISLAKVTCASNEFQCDNGRCIPAIFHCDGKFDCMTADSSDEINCTGM